MACLGEIKPKKEQKVIDILYRPYLGKRHLKLGFNPLEIVRNKCFILLLLLFFW